MDNSYAVLSTNVPTTSRKRLNGELPSAAETTATQRQAEAGGTEEQRAEYARKKDQLGRECRAQTRSFRCGAKGVWYALMMLTMVSISACGYQPTGQATLTVDTQCVVTVDSPAVHNMQSQAAVKTAYEQLKHSCIRSHNLGGARPDTLRVPLYGQF